MKKEYEERYCIICGAAFTPKRSSQVTCASVQCKKARQRRCSLEWHKKNHTRTLEANRNYMRRKREEPVIRKDTLIAIGYAERQREQTLQMVGRVKVEL